jgi:DVNP family
MNSAAIAGSRHKTQRLSKYGSRRKVWNGSAEKTKGGLTRKDLKQNKYGRIVSVKRSQRGGALQASQGNNDEE